MAQLQWDQKTIWLDYQLSRDLNCLQNLTTSPNVHQMSDAIG